MSELKLRPPKENEEAIREGLGVRLSKAEEFRSRRVEQ
jgi:hypothetical protein